jgi:hypothetical protein
VARAPATSVDRVRLDMGASSFGFPCKFAPRGKKVTVARYAPARAPDQPELDADK